MCPILLRLLSSGPDILSRHSVYHEKKKPYPTSVSESEDNNMKHHQEKKKPYPTSVSEPEDNNMKHYHEKTIPHPTSKLSLRAEGTSVSQPEDNNP